MHQATKNVLVSDPVNPSLLGTLRENGLNVDYEPGIDGSALGETIGKYEAVIIRSRTKLTKNIIQAAENLKLIMRAGVGLDGIDISAAKERGIVIMNVPEAATQSVAELTIALAIDASRNIPALSVSLKSGEFVKQVGVELSGKTFGMIGFGRIGHRVAEIARSLGMNIIAYDIFQDHRIDSVSGRYVSLEELCRESEYIGIFVSMNSGEPPILRREHFAMMQKKPVIVNTSRGAAIDGPELLIALQEGKVKSYTADVLWNEPPKDEWEHSLLKLQNVIITPHIGAQTEEAQARIAEMAAKKIVQFFSAGSI